MEEISKSLVLFFTIQLFFFFFNFDFELSSNAKNQWKDGEWRLLFFFLFEKSIQINEIDMEIRIFLPFDQIITCFASILQRDKLHIQK